LLFYLNEGRVRGDKRRTVYHRVKIILQNSLSLLYLGEDGMWVSDISNARDFGTSLKAMDFFHKNKLDQSQIVLKFSDAKYDIVLQMRAKLGNQSGDRAQL
jgi:hypothetical protein